MYFQVRGDTEFVDQCEPYSFKLPAVPFGTCFLCCAECIVAREMGKVEVWKTMPGEVVYHDVELSLFVTLS